MLSFLWTAGRFFVISACLGSRLSSTRYERHFGHVSEPSVRRSLAGRRRLPGG